MYQSTYYVDKTTDTFADVLLAYGVASLVERLLQANGGQRTARVQDAGSVYAIGLEDPIEEGFEDLDWFCDLPFIHTHSKRPPEGWPGMVVDYMRPGGLPFMSICRCTRQDCGAFLGKITTDKEIHDGSQRKIVYFSIRGYLFDGQD
jgi:hypothetical protein